jgi:hypothetical protein
MCPCGAGRRGVERVAGPSTRRSTSGDGGAEGYEGSGDEEDSVRERGE